jgi:hypothetical protein
MAQTGASITHPPELDLPQSLKVPENIRGDVRVPQEFRCPLGSGVMSQPVVAPCGLTYDRYAFRSLGVNFYVIKPSVVYIFECTAIFRAVEKAHT